MLSLSHSNKAGSQHRIDPVVMSCFLSLPAEILVLVLRHSNINGDLARLRLTCSHVNALILQYRNRYLQDICIEYGISQRVLDIYNAGLDISADVVTTLNSSYKNAAPRPATR